MDDFLKQGGIDLEGGGAEEEEVKSPEENTGKRDSKEPEVPVYSTEPDERMCGYLNKTSVKVPGGEGG